MTNTATLIHDAFCVLYVILGAFYFLIFLKNLAFIVQLKKKKKRMDKMLFKLGL